MTTEERLLRLENAFATLVELQRGLEERFDTHQTWINELGVEQVKLTAAQKELAAAQKELAAAQARTETALAQLAEAQAHTDRRLDALIDIIREERNGKS